MTDAKLELERENLKSFPTTELVYQIRSYIETLLVLNQKYAT